MKYTSSVNNDPLITFLINQAKETPEIELLTLFGSRARSDHHPKSDYDIAVTAPKFSHSDWSIWSLRLKENAPTLCGLDLVLLNETTSSELRQRIQTEGVTLYEKKSS